MRSRKLIISCKCFQALIQKHPNSRFGSWKLSFHVLISWDNQSCKCFQAHIQTCYNFLKRSWKYYDHTLRKRRFLCTVTTFLSTVWECTWSPKRANPDFHILRKQRQHRPNISHICRKQHEVSLYNSCI